MSDHDGSLQRYYVDQIKADLHKRKSEHCCSRGVAREHCIDHRPDESEAE